MRVTIGKPRYLESGVAVRDVRLDGTFLGTLRGEKKPYEFGYPGVSQTISFDTVTDARIGLELRYG